LIEDSYENGLALFNTSATVDATVIQTTKPMPQDGTGGDALFAFASSQLELTRSRLEGSERAGVALYGAAATSKSTLLLCDNLPFAVEKTLITDGVQATLKDGGENVCLCDDKITRCTASSSELTPPTPLAPLKNGKAPSGPIQQPPIP
jgi:hypothetical protein